MSDPQPVLIFIDGVPLVAEKVNRPHVELVGWAVASVREDLQEIARDWATIPPEAMTEGDYCPLG